MNRPSHLSLSSLLICSSLMACGGGDEEAKSGAAATHQPAPTATATQNPAPAGSDPNASTESNADAATETASEPETAEAPEVAEEPVWKPLNPADVTADTVLAASDLHNTIFERTKKTMLVHGFFKLSYGEEGTIGKEAQLMGTVADTTPPIGVRTHPKVRCRLKTAFEEPVKQSAVLVIKGTVDGITWFSEPSEGHVKMRDCEVVAVDPENVEALASEHPADFPPISAQALYEDQFAWVGKEVTVEGYYFSETTSTTKSGVSYRIDMSKPTSGLNSPILGCHVAQEPPAGMEDNREGVQVRGTIGKSSHPRVKLEPCTIANR